MTFLKTLTYASSIALLAAAAQAAEVKIAMNGADDPVANAEAAFAHGFADALEGTEFEVKIFPSNTLGSESERYDQIAQGLVEVNLATTSTAFGMSPLVKGAAMPFFFADATEFDKVIGESDIMDEMNAPLVENGVRMVGFNFIGVGIGIHNAKKPISKLADMQGMRFRALNAEQLAFQEALGSSGTIVAWAEVANAIQTGVADGYFNPPNSAIRTGHTEFLKHFTPANIAPSIRSVLISEDWYMSLSDEEKAEIDAAIEAGIKANRDWVEAWSTEVRTRHEAAGVTITELAPGEREKMIALSEGVWATTLNPEELKLWTDAKASVQ
ncbi:TRAP transporter substrate-binding protein [Celeribacter litoreus]|uniref:TRAP transporter substrate-binding protein n=1 Tax=Celeribacter litoreus TaxID=2876714 RepID=UPI001CCA90EF|nr:TRAP transporter substrate-binding protein [Celeribacter litoreus]MCA0045057.1 TRAP transporter substrate-binding protein [Celeribacter litoreus]